MATLRTVYVDPDSGAGSPTGATWALAYTSLNQAEQAQDDTGDLVSRDEYIEFHCGHNGASQTTADTAYANINGWTTDATRNITVLTEAADRHNGQWSATKYRMVVANSPCLDSNEDFVSITGLQCQASPINGGGQGPLFLGTNNASARVNVSHCVLVGASNSGTAQTGLSIIHNTSSGAVAYVWNTIIYGIYARAGSIVLYHAVGSAGAVNAYHVTGIGGETGFWNRGTSALAKNCYFGGSSFSTASDFYGTITKTTCASEDSSGSTGLTSINCTTAGVTFTDPANGDFHIADTDSALYDVGTTLTDDPPGSTALGVDIAGTTRS